MNLELKKLHKIAKQNVEKKKMVQDIQLEKDESFAPQLQILSPKLKYFEHVHFIYLFCLNTNYLENSQIIMTIMLLVFT